MNSPDYNSQMRLVYENKSSNALVAYTMKITDVDPIRYGLLFERFLSPDRVSMPDEKMRVKAVTSNLLEIMSVKFLEMLELPKANQTTA